MMTTSSMLIDQNTIRRRGVGLIAANLKKAFLGYTLFAPMSGQGEVYLVDLHGEVRHQWRLPHPPGLYGYLLPNGNLFYSGNIPEERERVSQFARFKGGIILEADWDGNIVWQYRHLDHHHDARRLRNGNVIFLTLEKIPREMVSRIKGGIPDSEADGDIYADAVREVTPAGEIVWTWHAYEHFDPESHTITPHDRRHEWTHGNTVDELSDGNIILSFRNISTVVIVDKSTGNIIWELGDDVLAQQHFPNELPNGNILIYDNGTYRRGEPQLYSRVIEVDRKTREIVWQYIDNPPRNFFSAYISGAQRLPNGNMLITEGNKGRVFEVTLEGEVVWEYMNPYFGKVKSALDGQGPVYEDNAVFRSFRYAPEQVPRLR